MLPDVNTRPAKVLSSYCRLSLSVIVVLSEYVTWLSTSTDTMPPVRTWMLMSPAVGVELSAANAGGCNTMVPVAVPAALATL